MDEEVECLFVDEKINGGEKPYAIFMTKSSRDERWLTLGEIVNFEFDVASLV
jgi:hypothetical protein